MQEGINTLHIEIDNIPEPEAKPIPVVIDYFKHFYIWIRIWAIQLTYHIQALATKLYSKKLIYTKSKRLNFITVNFDKALKQISNKPLQILETKLAFIREIKSSIYGAYGEQKVVNILQELSHNYILINDFVYSFQKPLYNRRQNEYIKSVQIDHILIAPSGIFLIETKNWSSESLQNQNFYSPIQQIKRANFALYILLKNAVSKSFLNFNHHWGNREIPIRNVIVFINSKPTEKFQFVKTVTLNQLLPYITYFEPTFTPGETEKVADYLLGISHQREVVSKLKLRK